MATYKRYGQKSPMACWAAKICMELFEGDTRQAKKKYVELMPKESVSGWAAFARRCYESPDPAARVPTGRHPKISDELALKIGMVYTQRQLWSHGRSRPYASMAEVSSKVGLGVTRPPVPHLPAPSPPISSNALAAAGVPAAPRA